MINDTQPLSQEPTPPDLPKPTKTSKNKLPLIIGLVLLVLILGTVGVLAHFRSQSQVRVVATTSPTIPAMTEQEMKDMAMTPSLVQATPTSKPTSSTSPNAVPKSTATPTVKSSATTSTTTTGTQATATPTPQPGATATPTPTPSATPTPTPGPTSCPNTGTTINIAIGDYNFVPSSQIVSCGDTVVWTNSGGTTHTVTSTPSGPLHGNVTPTATYTYTFTSRGTFNYYCTIHSSMTGSISVL